MPHYSELRAIVIDVPEDDHDRELAFWQGAIGEELHGEAFGRWVEEALERLLAGRKGSWLGGRGSAQS